MVVAAKSLIGLLGKKNFSASDGKAALMMMIACDLQLLAGLAVYYLGGHLLSIKQKSAMHDHYSRFFAIEHPVSMLIGIILVHTAYSTAKKNMDSKRTFTRLFWYSFIALFLFVAMTPWPGKPIVGKPWLAAISLQS